VREYGWYLWHFLFQNYLQQVWSLFAVLFAFGGLGRERSIGNALFSLGLPVSRQRWLFSRLGVATCESVALSLFAVIFVAVGSRVIHQVCPVGEMLLHSLLMVAAGSVLIAIGNLLYSLFSGGYVALLATLVLLGTPYLLLQTILQDMRDGGHSSWLRYFDIAHAMAGSWKLTWTTAPWLALCITWVLTACFLTAAVIHGDRLDY
jgi:ABC-type transport system involved in multi-copper enzyme maturation permease subunit